MKSGRVVVFGILLGLALSSACGRPRSSLSGPVIHDIPSIRLGPLGTIRSFDALVDERQTLHTVWIESEESEPVPGNFRFKCTLSYQQGTNLGASWRSPIHLCEDEAQQARLIECGGTLHVLIGDRCRDFASSDRGVTWQERPPLVVRLEGQRRYVRQFDVATADSTLIVVYADAHGRAEHAKRDSTDFWIVSRRGNQTTEPRLIGSVEGEVMYQTFPHLYASSDGLVVVYGLRLTREMLEVGSDGQPVTRSWDVGDVALFRSADNGTSWSGPSYLPEPNNGAQHWLTVDQVNLFAASHRHFLLFDSRGALHTAPITGGQIGSTSWQQSISVQLMDELNSRDFDCAAHGNDGTLAWIAAHNETKGSPLLDLVQRWPSDVYLARLNTSDNNLRVGTPRRLTFATNEVTAVRVFDTPRGALVVWSEMRLKPLLLGGGRKGGMICYALIDTM